MKKVTKILMGITAIAVIALMACNKEGIEENTSSVTTPSTNISSRGGEASTDQAAAGEAYKADILMWKAKVDAWRAGTSSTETMDATAAVEKLESVFNYYLCDAGKSYNVDKTVQAVIEVQGTNLNWNSTKVASTFEAIKAKVVESFDALSGTDKGIRFIDLGTPTVNGGNLRFHIDINMGEGVVTEEAPPATLPDPTDGVKWGDIEAAPIGSCQGDANVLIGSVVNQRIGFYLKNLPPNFPGNPKQKPGIILFNIGLVSTNKGANDSPALDELFIKNTLDLLDPTAIGGAPTYPNKGKYKIHCDLNTNQFCFSKTKTLAYVNSYKEVGNNADYLGRVRTLPSKGTNILIGVYVSSQKTETKLPDLSKVVVREHPVLHYYAKPLVVFVEDKEIPDEF